MRIPKAKSKTNGLVVLFALVGLMFGTAGPAVAADEVVGAGAGIGWEYAEDGGPGGSGCTLPPAGDWIVSTFVLYHEATYDAVDTVVLTDVVSYVGPIVITMTTEPYAAAPQGAAPECGAPILVPGAVELQDISIEAPGPFISGTVVPGGDVECDGNEGTFTRVNTTVVFDFVVECNITGNVLTGTVEEQDIHHLIEGNMVICGIAPPIIPTPPSNPACTITGHPLEDPNAGTNDAASAILQTVHEAETATT